MRLPGILLLVTGWIITWIISAHVQNQLIFPTHFVGLVCGVLCFPREPDKQRKPLFPVIALFLTNLMWCCCCLVCWDTVGVFIGFSACSAVNLSMCDCWMLVRIAVSVWRTDIVIHASATSHLSSTFLPVIYKIKCTQKSKACHMLHL